VKPDLPGDDRKPNSKEKPPMDVRKTLEDAAYITVGVGVIAFQQAQVRRREVQATVEQQAKDTKAFLESRAQDGQRKLESLARDLRGKAESVPGQVKQAVDAGTTRARELVNRAA
jgi:hypothetical protein